jgi:hypothetical protein
MAASPDSFVAYLRPKRAWMAFLFAWTLLGGAVLPLVLSQYYDAFLVGTSEDELIAAWAPMATLSRVTGLGLLGMSWWLPVAAATFGLLVQLALEALIWRARLDRRDIAWSSLAWTARSWPSAMAYTCMGLALLGFMPWAVPGFDAPVALFAIAAAIWLLVAPFLAGNPANVTRDVPPLWWRPRWPGTFAVALAIVAIVAKWGLGFASERVVGTIAPDGAVGWVLALAFWLLMEFLGLMLIAYVGLVWLDRRTRLLGRSDLRRVWSGEVLGALVVSWLRPLGWTAAALPVLALATLQVFVWPQVYEVVRGDGGQLPQAWQAVVAATHFAQRWWWIVVIWPAVWLLFVQPGRLFARLGFASSP